MIEHTTTVKFRDGGNELEFQKVLDEMQKAMPKRKVYRGTPDIGGRYSGFGKVFDEVFGTGEGEGSDGQR